MPIDILMLTHNLSMKILVFGRNGWIAGQIHPLLTRVGDIVYAASRLQDQDAVSAELDAVSPDKVILCAGITGRPNVDWCETHVEETMAVNYYGTLHLITACNERGIHITNFATGCIFQYDDTHPIGGSAFTEEDIPNFFGSVYSRFKAAVETATKSLPNQLLFRIRMPITCDSSPRCFVTKIANYNKIVDIPNSVSVLPDLLPLAVEMIRSGDVGVYNLVNPEPVSHTQILDAYAEIVDPLFLYNVMDMAEHNTVVKAGRSNNALCTAKLQIRFPGITIPTAVSSIRNLFERNMPALRGQHIPRSILVTGGCGFIGSGFVRFVKSPQRKPISVIVLDRMDACSSRMSLHDCDVTIIEGDIADIEKVSHILAEHNVDTIVHFAAQTHVDASFESAFAFTETNVLGTHKLLHATTTAPSVKRFIHMSTDEVYGETTDHTSGVKEDVFLQPTNPYAASKVGAEALVCAYQKSYGLNAVIIRANNVYGPGQYPEKLIPRFLLRHQLGLPLQVQGSGHQTRHFLYLSDAIRAICVVVSRGLSGSIYNIASKDELSVLGVAKKIGGSTVSSVHVSDRKFNDQRYWVDDQKLRSIGWTQETSFDMGLKTTREWYATTELISYWPSYKIALHDLD